MTLLTRRATLAGLAFGAGVGGASARVLFDQETTGRLFPLAPGRGVPPRPALGTYAPNTAGSVQAFYDWLGVVPPEAFGDPHVGRGDNNPSGTFQGEMDDWTGSVGYVLDASAWAGAPGRVTHLAIPMFPKSGNFTDALAGKYDSAVRSIAVTIFRRLDLYQSTFLVRIGWEFNHIFQPWSIADVGSADNEVNPVKAAQHAEWWRRIWTIFRSVSPKFRFVWCTNLGHYDYRAAWPGARFVDYIGVDAYPGLSQPKAYRAPLPVSPSAQRALWRDTRSKPFCLDDVAAFARAQDKPLCIPEFAIEFDGEVFMALFLQWCIDNGVAYLGYWNEHDVDNVVSRLSTGDVPGTGACVRNRWNPARYPAPPVAPAYVPVNRFAASSALTDGAWQRNGVTIDPVSGQASPSGAPVFAVRPTTANGLHRFYQEIGFPPGEPATYLAEVKPDGYGFAYVNSAIGPNRGQVCFGLSGAGSTVNKGAAGDVTGITITPKADSWYELRIDGVTAGAAGYPFLQINQTDGSDQYFTGDPTRGLLVGRIQLLV